MRSFFSLLKKDLKGYFDQPTGYILLVIVLAVASALFFFRGVQAVEEASLRPLFSIMPFLLAVFVPAATMRLVAEEQRDGTLELLLTHPLRTSTILWAKFQAGFIFVGTGIVFTIGIPIALESAGDLDKGAIAAQYIGTLFLTASFVAIGLFTSSLTQNQIVAFILGIAIIGVLMLAGSPLIIVALPPAAAVLVQDLSPLSHYSSIVRGILDLRDVLYYVALVSTFLFGTYFMIRSKGISHHSPLFRNLQLGAGGLVIISVLVGWSGGLIGGRLDLTEERTYTLSPATKKLLSGLDDIVVVKLFASKDPAPQAALVQRDVNDFLDDVAAASKGKVRIVRRYPDADEDAAREAEQNYVPPVQFTDQSGGELNVKLGYLGMAMTYANRKDVMQYVGTLDGLEYDFASTIYAISRKDSGIVGFLGEAPGSADQDGEAPQYTNVRTLQNELKLHHEVETMSVSQEGLLDLGGTEVLVVPGPTKRLRVEGLEEIRSFLARGGKVLMLVDPVTVNQGLLEGEPSEASMADFLQEYGVKVNNDVVFDMRANATIGFPTRFGPVPRVYPYWVQAQTSERIVSGGANSAVMPWPSSLEIVEPTGKTVEVEATPLLETTRFGGIDYEYRDLHPDSAVLAQITEDDLGKRLVAVALTGTACPELQPKCEKNPDRPFRMIVVADSDWVSDGFLGRSEENLALAVNWIEWLAQEDTLTTIRAKAVAPRPLIYSSPAHRQRVQYSVIIGTPAFFVVLGLLRYYLRRQRTQREYTGEE